MPEVRRIRTEALKEADLRAGDKILLSGYVYTARDAAHKRIAAMLDAGEEPPFPIGGAVIYYAGPTPAPPGKPIGSCGLQPGDVIVHDSSIGINAPKNGKARVLTGREGQPIDKQKRYSNLAVTSGYEWKHNVLAVVRADVK